MGEPVLPQARLRCGLDLCGVTMSIALSGRFSGTPRSTSSALEATDSVTP